jgi:hypothetical protein
MYFLDDVWATEIEHFGDVFVPEPVALQIESASLEIGTHRPIEDDDALADEIEEGSTHAKVL